MRQRHNKCLNRVPTRAGRVKYDPPLDPGIARAVKVLAGAGVETYESCEGGRGHAYPEPTVRFYGEHAEGFRALAAALENGLPVAALRRIWVVQDGEPVGPDWEMTFCKDEQRPRRRTRS